MALPALFVLLICFVVLAWGLGRAVMGTAMRRRAWTVRGLALICLAVGVGTYALGVVLVGLSVAEASSGTDSSPAPACQKVRASVVSHRAGYLPPRFDCVLDDGTAYSAGISGWITPAAVVLVVSGVALFTDPYRRRAPVVV